MNRQCGYKCGASSKQCGVHGQSAGHGVGRVEHDMGNGGINRTINSQGGSEMEKVSVLGAEGERYCKIGGERVNSNKLKGEHRILKNQHFSSPT